MYTFVSLIIFFIIQKSIICALVLWILCHSLPSEQENTLENICVKNYWIISVILISQNQFSLLSHFTLSQIINSAHGHLVNISVSLCLCFSGDVDIQGCGHRILSGGVGMPEPCSAEFIYECDVRELQKPGLLG